MYSPTYLYNYILILFILFNMRKNFGEILTICICIFILGELLCNKTLVYSSVMEALNMWVKNLIPALFPFFIIADILVNYNISTFIPKIIRDFCKVIWNITDEMFSILVLSMVSGFPSNARNTRTLYDMGRISLEEANHILIFSHFSNPVFVLTTVGVFFLGNERVGIIILIAHYLSNFILGVCFRGKFRHNENVMVSGSERKDLGGIFIGAIRHGIDTILLICGIVVVFMMMATIIVDMLHLGSYNTMIVKGIMEITIGIQALSKLGINIIYKAVIASVFLAFGGLSVHVQVFSQITGTKIKYSYFLMGRLWQMILAGGITYLLMII